MSERQARTRERVLRVVCELLESEGYEAVQVRTVARVAQISLVTLYKLFRSRDELIVAALLQWMDGHVYAAEAPPPADATLYDVQMWVFRSLFRPWEDNPKVLAAYHRARIGPYGQQLDEQGLAAVGAIMETRLNNLDVDYSEDLRLILVHVYYAAVTRFAEGRIDVTDILPILERAVFRLTTDNLSLAAAFKGVT